MQARRATADMPDTADRDTGAAQEVLRLVAVAESCAPADLVALTGWPGHQVRRVIADLIARGELDERVATLRFRDPGRRAAVEAGLPGPVRASLHHSVGRYLATTGAAATIVAGHLERDAAAGDREVADWLRRAAAEVGRSEPDRALAYLERALDRLRPLDTERAVLLADRARLLLWVGRIDAAEAAATAGLALEPDPATVATLQTELGEALLLRGRPAKALAHLEAALALGTASGIGVAVDQRTEARCLAMAASARLWTFDLAGAERDARRALAAATRVGDPVATTTAFNVRCRLAAFGLDLDRAVALGEEAVRQAGDLPAALRTGPHLYLGLALVNADEPSRAREVLADGDRLCQQLGTTWAAPSYGNALALAGFFTGDWDGVLSAAASADRLAERSGVQLCSPQIHAICGLIAHHRGDDDGAQAAADRAAAELVAPAADQAGVPYLLWLRALIAEREGRCDEAVRLLDGADRAAVGSGVPLVTLWFAPDLVGLALGAREPAIAERVADRIATQAPRAGTRSVAAIAAYCRGLIDADPEALSGAAVGFRAAGRTLDAARAWEAAGVAHQRTKGPRTRAVQSLRQALAGYQQLGAERHSRRVRAALRDAGARVGATGRRHTATTTGLGGMTGVGGGELTPAESAVADLVARGLGNREIAEQLFVSKRTVESHISRIYTKLGVRSRVHLAREVAAARH